MEVVHLSNLFRSQLLVIFQLVLDLVKLLNKIFHLFIDLINLVVQLAYYDIFLLHFRFILNSLFLNLVALMNVSND